MTVLGVQIEIVKALQLVRGKRSISEMKPWFTEEDERGVNLLNHFVEMKFVPKQAFTIPSQYFSNKRIIKCRWSCISSGNRFVRIM